MSLRPPPSIQSIIGPGGRIDPHWERWLGELVRQINTPVQSGGEVAPVEPAAMVQGYGIAVTGAGTQDSPWVVRLRKIADSGTGALLGITRDAYGRVTGTVDATITGTTGEIDVTNGDAAAGVPTLSLADVTPTTGGSLKKYGFDAKGRRDKQDDATTDDLTEGTTNLYFTDARAYAAAKAQLVAGSNVTITADDGAKTLTIAATGGGGGGAYSEGTAFPGSPSLNDKFYRTDLNLLCYYDGTRWLTVHVEALSIDWKDVDGSINFNQRAGAVAARDDMYIVDATFAARVASGTNNGSNYWTTNLFKTTDSEVSTLVAGANTSGVASGVAMRSTVSVNAPIGTGHVHLNLWVPKTGSPGDLHYAVATIRYRLIVT